MSKPENKYSHRETMAYLQGNAKIMQTDTTGRLYDKVSNDIPKFATTCGCEVLTKPSHRKDARK